MSCNLTGVCVRARHDTLALAFGHLDHPVRIRRTCIWQGSSRTRTTRRIRMQTSLPDELHAYRKKVRVTTGALQPRPLHDCWAEPIPRRHLCQELQHKDQRQLALQTAACDNGEDSCPSEDKVRNGATGALIESPCGAVELAKKIVTLLASVEHVLTPCLAMLRPKPRGVFAEEILRHFQRCPPEESRAWKGRGNGFGFGGRVECSWC